MPIKHLTTYAEYMAIVGQHVREHPEWRPGQAAFNVLVMLRPDLSEQVRATALDPFHVDKPAFYTWVAEHWILSEPSRTDRVALAESSAPASTPPPSGTFPVHGRGRILKRPPIGFEDEEAVHGE